LTPDLWGPDSLVLYNSNVRNHSGYYVSSGARLYLISDEIYQLSVVCHSFFLNSCRDGTVPNLENCIIAYINL